MWWQWLSAKFSRKWHSKITGDDSQEPHYYKIVWWTMFEDIYLQFNKVQKSGLNITVWFIKWDLLSKNKIGRKKRRRRRRSWRGWRWWGDYSKKWCGRCHELGHSSCKQDDTTHISSKYMISFLLIVRFMYVYIPRYINTLCLGCIMLLVCIFSGLIILC